MRKELAKYRENSTTFTARISNIIEKNGVKRVVLTNVRKNKKQLTNHLWLTVNTNSVIKNVEKGTVIKFVAHSYLYTKKKNEIDYGLKVEKILKTYYV